MGHSPSGRGLIEHFVLKNYSSESVLFCTHPPNARDERDDLSPRIFCVYNHPLQSNSQPIAQFVTPIRMAGRARVGGVDDGAGVGKENDEDE
eukprot:m.184430 g.184430  ORF g.184430 m.184430 type:complete len:92 (+) comp24698_c0_seq2:306-581(+)